MQQKKHMTSPCDQINIYSTILVLESWKMMVIIINIQTTDLHNIRSTISKISSASHAKHH